MDRVSSFGRTPKGQSLFRQAVSRLSGGDDTRKGRGRGRTTRRAGGGRRTRTARKR